MKVKALRLFVSPVFGNVKEGDLIEVNEATAKQLLDLGFVEVEKAPLQKKPEQKQVFKKAVKK